MKLITRPKKFYNYVSYDVINEFEAVIQELEPTLSLINNDGYYIPILLKHLFLRTEIPLNSFFSKFDASIFTIHLGPDFARSLPYFIKYRHNYGYFFDIWPSRYAQMQKFLQKSNISVAFFSSQQTTEHFKQLGFANVYWVPEGIDANHYQYNSYQEKDIDVLEIGRKYSAFHDKITLVLKANNVRHLYEKQAGQIVFPERIDFIKGLARTKISICFPRSTTHPESAEGVDTMTNRYLQSMASKCLVVGEIPKEMINLFDYNPIVEINMENADQEIIRILNNFEDYIPLIEKNYKTILENHTWAVRWRQINSIIVSSNIFNN